MVKRKSKTLLVFVDTDYPEGIQIWNISDKEKKTKAYRKLFKELDAHGAFEWVQDAIEDDCAYDEYEQKLAGASCAIDIQIKKKEVREFLGRLVSDEIRRFRNDPMQSLPEDESKEQWIKWYKGAKKGELSAIRALLKHTSYMNGEDSRNGGSYGQHLHWFTRRLK